MQPLFADEHPQPFFTMQQLSELDFQKIPKHIAIIMDGNRRWASCRKQICTEGHREGADILLDIVLAAKELTVSHMTVYGFSTENWNRPKDEVEAILWLIEQYAIEQRPNMIANGVKVKCIGDLSSFPDTLQEALEETCNASSHCSDIELVLALNYGSRDEICRAVNSILEEMQAGQLPHSAITESLISQYLDTKGLPELDLLIRPGGEMRLSNFLSWQAAYSEFYFLEKMWPDFCPNDLYQAILTYQQRQRRLGA